MKKTPSEFQLWPKRRSNPERLAEIQSLKRQIKKLLKRGEAVYVEHSATGGKLV